MANTAKKTSPKSATKKVVKSVELMVTDQELTYDDIWNFVQTKAGESLAERYYEELCYE